MRVTSRVLIFIFILTGLCLSAAAQQKMYEPKKGNPERTAIMDAIRNYDTKRDASLKAEKFNVLSLRVQGNWAFAHVEQQNLGNTESYGVAQVFLQKVGNKWVVVFSTYNDKEELGVDGITKIKKKYKDFPKQLENFAVNQMAG